MPFPETCVRGILNRGFLLEGGEEAAPHLFFFHQRYARDGDGLIEQSVNWEDDASVVDFTLNQSDEDGEPLFHAGVARLPRSEVDRINSWPGVEGEISYERQPLEGNPYHGNLLLSSDVPKKKMKMIAAGLALASEVISG